MERGEGDGENREWWGIIFFSQFGNNKIFLFTREGRGRKGWEKEGGEREEKEMRRFISKGKRNGGGEGENRVMG